MEKMKAVTLHRGRWLGTMGDSRDYLLRYFIIDWERIGTPDEAVHTQTGNLMVRVATQLITVLGYDADDEKDKDKLEMIVFGHVRQYIEDRIYHDEAVEAEVELTTDNPPQETNPNRIEILWHTPLAFPVM